MTAITNRLPNDQWAIKRAMILGAICLVVGMAAGWLIRGWESPQPSDNVNAASTKTRAGSSTATPDPARLKQDADVQAAPLLEQLKAKPDDAALLTGIGNIYYDAQQYPVAIDYYGRALKLKPTDASVRTDMGTAYWYMGNADSAIAQFDIALNDAPNNANTLFNRGLVKWQGKNNPAGAVEDWKKLLATNPNYEARDKVQHMLEQVQKQASTRP